MVHCKSRMTIWLLIAVAVTLMLGVAPAPTLAQEKIIKIGTIFPLTGPVALAGQRCKAAVETAVEIINNKHPNIKVPLAAQAGVARRLQVRAGACRQPGQARRGQG